MKFRAVMKDVLHMREFLNITSVLSKLAKDFIMKICMDRVYFMANEVSNAAAPLVWFDISASRYFNEYKMEPVATNGEQQPQILLEISTTNLHRALGTLRGNVRYCKIKLTNIQFPCLTIETEVNESIAAAAAAAAAAGEDEQAQQQNQQQQQQQQQQHLVAQKRSVVHDVPVTIIARCDWDAHRLPLLPAPELALFISPMRLMRGLIDKVKNLSPNITFYGTNQGDMNLVAEAELATITIRYKNLELLQDCAAAAIASASCAVDCRKASVFFNALLQLPTEQILCGINHERSIHFRIDVREGVYINAIMPAICVE